MGRSFLLKIRMELLRVNLSAADGADYSRAHVRRWLHDAGFEPAGPWWRVREANLLLDPAEVSELIPEAEAGESRPLRRARVA